MPQKVEPTQRIGVYKKFQFKKSHKLYFGILGSNAKKRSKVKVLNHFDAFPTLIGDNAFFGVRGPCESSLLLPKSSLY